MNIVKNAKKPFRCEWCKRAFKIEDSCLEHEYNCSHSDDSKKLKQKLEDNALYISNLFDESKNIFEFFDGLKNQLNIFGVDIYFNELPSTIKKCDFSYNKKTIFDIENINMSRFEMTRSKVTYSNQKFCGIGFKGTISGMYWISENSPLRKYNKLYFSDLFGELSVFNLSNIFTHGGGSSLTNMNYYSFSYEISIPIEFFPLIHEEFFSKEYHQDDIREFNETFVNNVHNLYNELITLQRQKIQTDRNNYTIYDMRKKLKHIGEKLDKIEFQNNRHIESQIISENFSEIPIPEGFVFNSNQQNVIDKWHALNNNNVNLNPNPVNSISKIYTDIQNLSDEVEVLAYQRPEIFI